VLHMCVITFSASTLPRPRSVLFIHVDHSLLKAALIEHCQQWVRHFTRLLNDNAQQNWIH